MQNAIWRVQMCLPGAETQKLICSCFGMQTGSKQEKTRG